LFFIYIGISAIKIMVENPLLHRLSSVERMISDEANC
jgi:hypothetical protein